MLKLIQDDFAAESVDLYDDVIAAPATAATENNETTSTPAPAAEETNGTTYQAQGNNITPSSVGRKHQLYVGNLTWVSTQGSLEYNYWFYFYIYLKFSIKNYIFNDSIMKLPKSFSKNVHLIKSTAMH